MSRIHNRLSKKNGKKLMKLGWNEFEDITESSKLRLDYRTEMADRIYQNNIFIVQVYDRVTEWGMVKKAMIRRNDALPVHNWQVFQRLKNEIFGEDATALEVYPKKKNLVDVANMYWLWVLPQGFDCPLEMRQTRMKKDNEKLEKDKEDGFR